jgi:hypothetical protein
MNLPEQAHSLPLYQQPGARSQQPHILNCQVPSAKCYARRGRKAESRVEQITILAKGVCGLLGS